MPAEQQQTFTLIGDLVGSRQVKDRSTLNQRLVETLTEMNEVLTPSVPLEPTIGDEFQACFDDVAAAVRAGLTIRLALLRVAGTDSRYGLGVGKVEVFAKRSPISQDGPGWWAAREAIDSCRKAAATPRTSFVRTYFAARDDWEGDANAVNAFLLSRDALLAQMKQRGRNRLYGLMRGWSQAEIAAQEGISQSAVSQGLSQSGAFAILAAQEELERKAG